MKKNILIFCAVLATFSLTAFGYMNWNNDNLAEIDMGYKVDSRFMTTITKEDLHKATSVLDIVPKVAEGWWKVSFQTVTVVVLQDGNEIREVGEEKALNDTQIALLKSADYSTNFYIKARSKTKHPETGIIEDYTYHFTIIPEKEAEFARGQDALVEYLTKNTQEYTANIEEDKLQFGQISFTVTKAGKIANVKLSGTSGYPSVDEALVELVSNMPGKWRPAKNSKGEKIDQELMLFFGRQGC